MRIKFNILDLEVELALEDDQRKKWWFNNANPKIPLEKKLEDLTEDEKISLVRLALFENHIDTEELANLHKSQINIVP